MYNASFFRFLKFEVMQRVMMWRWLLPIPIILWVGYRSVNSALIQASHKGMDANIWDGLFIFFGSHLVVFLLLTPLFLSLVSDWLPELAYGQMVLIRLRSRRLWWLGKTAALALAVVIYLTMNIVPLALIGGISLPWEGVWSEAARNFPAAFYIPPGVRTFPPALAFGGLILLLALGWFSLGLLVLVIGVFSRHLGRGFIAGVCTVLIGWVALSVEVRPPFAHLFIHDHLLLARHVFDPYSSSYPTVMASIVYWGFWMLGLFLLGYRRSAKLDFGFQGPGR